MARAVLVSPYSLCFTSPAKVKLWNIMVAPMGTFVLKLD